MKRSFLLLIAAAVIATGVAAVVLFVVPLFNKPPTKDRPPEIPALPQRERAAVPRVIFTDVTDAAGIKFRHTNGAFGKKLLPETMGSGAAFLDFDNDGKQDLLFVNSRPWPGEPGAAAPTLALYRNRGDGTFEDVTAKLGLDVSVYGMGAAVGDYDNDGFVDVYVTAVGGSRLFRNDGGKKFVDVTPDAGGGGGGGWPGMMARDDFLKLKTPIPWPTSAGFVDFDGDGRLDLFVCHYVTWSPGDDLDNKFTIDGVNRAYGPPKSFEGAQCILYRNVDGKRFEDVSAKAGVQVFNTEGVGPAARKRSVAKALGVIVCDPDNDGWPDIAVANDTVRNFFFHNVAGPGGARRFEEKGETIGFAYAEGTPRGGMGIDGAEYLPGRFAVIIANFADEPTTFLGLDRSGKLSFSDTALAVGVSGQSRAPLKFGTFFLDYDLDGRPDIVTNNGHLEPEIEKVRKGQTFEQTPQIFWNTGQARGSTFETTSPKEIGDDLFKPMVGRGSAYADIDGDGDPDLVLTGNGGPARLLRNDLALGHHWVRLALQGDGQRSNRSAVGAVVTVEAGGTTYRRTVCPTRGYLSQSELPVTVGLGATSKIDKVTVRWPGKDAGPDTVLTDVAVDKTHTIIQGK